jgi:hypothetical protein
MPPETVYCTKCGKSMAETAAECPNCLAVRYNPQRKTSTGLGGLALLVLLLAAGIAWLFRGQQRPPESPHGGPVSSNTLEYWSERAALLQRTEAELAHNRGVLSQQAQDPSNAPYRQRVVEFLDLTAKLHGHAHQGWEEAIRRKDTRGEAGYALADIGISNSLYQMSGVIDQYKSGGTPQGRAAEDLQYEKQKYEDSRRILARYSQDQSAVRFEDPSSLGNLLDKANRVLDEGNTILVGGDDLGALLAWVEASFLESYVTNQSVAFLGLLEPASSHT